LDLFDHLFREVVSLIETGELFGSSIHLTPAKQFPNKKIRKTEAKTDKRISSIDKQTVDAWREGQTERTRHVQEGNT